MHKVLLVEDDPSIIRLLEIHLTEAGFKTIEARDVGTAWKTVQEETPAVVIVDLGLPGVYGWELVERMRRDSRFTHTPVLIVSGGLGPDETQRAHELACDWLEKPFEPDRLLEKIDSVIRDKRWLARHRQKVRLFTDALVVEGYLYVALEHERFSDALEELMYDDRRFLPLTNGRISSLSGTLLDEPAFCEIAKADIQSIAPLEET